MCFKFLSVLSHFPHVILLLLLTFRGKLNVCHSCVHVIYWKNEMNNMTWSFIGQETRFIWRCMFPLHPYTFRRMYQSNIAKNCNRHSWFCRSHNEDKIFLKIFLLSINIIFVLFRSCERFSLLFSLIALGKLEMYISNCFLKQPRRLVVGKQIFEVSCFIEVSRNVFTFIWCNFYIP